MTFPAHNFWLGLRYTFGALALGSVVYMRFWLGESLRTGSWKKGHRSLWKKPKRWQLILFSVLWGVILIGFLIAVILNRK